MTRESVWLSSGFTPISHPCARLIVLPYAGGTSNTYRGWQSRLGARHPVEVIPIELPGRMGNTTAPLGTVQQLTDAITNALLACTAITNNSCPVVIFGHSYGAILGLELANRLIFHHVRVELVIASSSNPPAHLNRETHQRISEQSIAETHAYFESLGGGIPQPIRDNHSLMEMLEQCVRADYNALACYGKQNENFPLLPCPLIAVYGDSDIGVTSEDMAHWNQHTTGKFTLESLKNANHFFIEDSSCGGKEWIIQLIDRCIGDLLTFERQPSFGTTRQALRTRLDSNVASSRSGPILLHRSLATFSRLPSVLLSAVSPGEQLAEIVEKETWPTHTIVDVLAGKEDEIAIECFENGTLTKLSRREVAHRMWKAAEQISLHGVKTGDTVVVVVSSNTVNTVIVVLATMAIGAIALPFSSEALDCELSFMVNDVSPTMVILPEIKRSGDIDVPNGLKGCCCAAFNADGKILRMDGVERKESTRIKPEKPKPSDPCLLLYITEGTISRPKVTRLTHRNLLAGIHNLCGAYELTKDDKCLLVNPLLYINSIMMMLSTLSTQGVVVLTKTGKFSAKTFFDEVATHSVTWHMAVPTVYRLLLRRQTEFQKAGCPRLRFMASSCEKQSLLPGDVSALELAFDTVVLEGFALPESSQLIASTPLPSNGERHSGFLGHAVGETRIRIVGADGKDVSDGDSGHIFARGPSINHRLYREQEKSSKVQVTGWLNTGFSGSYSNDRGLCVQSCGLPIVNRAGEKLELSEIQNALAGPKEALVTHAVIVPFAAPHQLLGEVPGVLFCCQSQSSESIERLAAQYSVQAIRQIISSAGTIRSKWLPSVVVWCDGKHTDEQSYSHLPQEEISSSLGLKALDSAVPVTHIYRADKQTLEPVICPSSMENVLSQVDERVMSVVSNCMADVLDLKVDVCTPSANFFQLGGSSLQVIPLINLLRDRLGITVSQDVIFLSPTVRELAIQLRNMKKDTKEVKLLTHRPDNGGKWWPASYSQEQMHIVYQQGFKSSYNMPWIVSLNGRVDLELLRRAIMRTAEAHGALRTVVKVCPETGCLMQKVRPVEETENCVLFNADHCERTVKGTMEFLQDKMNYIFDLENGPVLQVEVVHCEEDGKYYVLVNCHHLGSDGWSITEHRRQIANCYRSFLLGSGDGMPQLPVDFVDFTLFQRQVLDDVGALQMQYWKEELDDLPHLDLPLDKPRPSVLSDRGGKVHVHIPTQTVKLFDSILAKRGATPFIGCIAIYHILLYRFSGQEDMVCGAATANRNYHPGLADCLGYFANILAIRTDLGGKPDFEEYLDRVRTKVLGAWRNQDLPFHKMAASLDLPRDSSTTAVFQAMFALQEASWHEIDVDLSETGCNMEIVRLENERSKFAVHLMLRGRTDGGLDGDFLYSTDLFTRDTAERMARGYEMLYHAACEHPNGIPISRLSILDEAQQCALMNSANIVTDFPSPRRVDAWVRDAAKQYPDNIALIDADGNSCSYQVLQQRTDELAWFLAEEMGVKEGSTVGMIFDRSIEMFVTILGVLKSGATYVPVDGAKTPAPRISFMLSDTEVKLLIVHDQYATMTQNDVDLDDDVRVVRWSELKASLVPALQRNPSFVPPVVNSENVDALACILYTSGTTGAPKGVMIAHSSVSNLIGWWIRYISMTCEDKMLQFSSYSFVMSLRQIFPCLSCGASLVLPTANSLDFGEVIERHGVTCMALTPSALSTVDASRCSSLTRVQVAGEPPSLALCKFWSERLDGFHVGLGPTELTAHALCGQFDVNADSVNVGYPVMNCAAYIVNGDDQLQPFGVVGELWVAGADVSRGYLKRPDKTSQSFTPNPFDPQCPLLYKTGDLARMLPSGRVQFIGRRDAQVKIRGFRVELAEVAAVILQHPKINRAEVILANNMLVAYVTPLVGDDTLHEVKGLVKDQLPTYAVPSAIVPLEKFPLNKNGKLDRPALPPPVILSQTTNDSRLQPSSQLEKLVRSVWAEILSISEEGIGSDSNFFELTGSSLTAIMMSRKMGERLGTTVPAIAVFANQTVGAFCDMLVDEGLVPEDALAQLSSDDESQAFRKGVAMRDLIDEEVEEVKGRALPSVVFQGLIAFSILFSCIIGFLPAVAAIVACVVLGTVALGYPAIPLFPLVWMCAMVLEIVLVVLVKRCAIGRLKCGRYHKRSLTFVRWYAARQLTCFLRVWVWSLSETPLLNVVYRAMGANIAWNVSLDEVQMEDVDQVTLKEGCHLQHTVVVSPGEVIGDTLVLRAIALDEYCTVGPRASLLGGSMLPKGCTVTSRSCTTASTCRNYRLQPRTVLHGAPAMPDIEDFQDDDTCCCTLPRQYGKPVLTCVQLLGIVLLFYMVYGAITCSVVIALVLFSFVGILTAIAYIFTVFFLPMSVVLLLLGFILRYTIGVVSADQQYSGVWFLFRRWLYDRFLLSFPYRLAVRVLTQEGTSFPLYCRLMGITLGWGAWMGRHYIRMGSNLFSAGMEGIYTVPKITTQGYYFAPVSVGDHCSFGQRTVLFPSVLGDRCTVGSEALVTEGLQMEDESSVMGCPPLIFKSTATDRDQVRALQKAAADKDGLRENEDGLSNVTADQHVEQEPYKITKVLVLLAMFILQPFFPTSVTIVYGGLLLIPAVLFVVFGISLWYLLLFILPVFIVGTVIIVIGLIILRQIGLSNFQSGATQFYSFSFFLWWLFYQYNDLVGGYLLYPIYGTRLYGLWLWCMGGSAGCNTFIAPQNGGFREPDCVHVGDEGMVLSSNVHGHYIDHGALQFAKVVMGNHSIVNMNATLMPLTTLDDDCTMRSSCTTIKGQKCSGDSVYLGNPAAAV